MASRPDNGPDALAILVWCVLGVEIRLIIRQDELLMLVAAIDISDVDILVETGSMPLPSEGVRIHTHAYTEIPREPVPHN